MGKMTTRYDMTRLQHFLQQPKTLQQISAEFGLRYEQTKQMINVATFRLPIYEEQKDGQYFFGIMEG